MIKLLKYEIRKRNRNKIEQLQELVFKSLAIKHLIKRNKDKNSKPGAKKNGERAEIHENPTFNPKKDESIYFPFIVVLSPSTENSVRELSLFDW